MGIFDGDFSKFASKNAKQINIKNKTDQVSDEPKAKNISEVSPEERLYMVRKAFRKFRNTTKKEACGFELLERETTLFESKVGGLPYAPHNAKLPTDSEGRMLKLLAQINCEDIEFDEMPKTGILQFWILDDDEYGMNYKEKTLQDRFRVVYYKDIDFTVTDDEIKEIYRPFEPNPSYFPVKQECAIDFSIKKESMQFTNCMATDKEDKKFTEIFNKMYPETPIKGFDDVYDEMEKVGAFNISLKDHKVGGYPGFTQRDPRKEGDDHDFLLFQLDSERAYSGEYGKYKVIWGDVGVANFFINRKKLKALDFSDVLYNWDCY